MSAVYNEKYINTAGTVEELIKILSELPTDTYVEVWYDEDVNTVIFK